VLREFRRREMYLLFARIKPSEKLVMPICVSRIHSETKNSDRKLEALFVGFSQLQ
jgi:hypothetical protein